MSAASASLLDLQRQYTNSMNSARAERKKVENDALLLANRIALLKQETAKAKRKIDETKKRTDNIQVLQMSNEERFREKHQMALAREEERSRNAELFEKSKVQMISATHQNISKVLRMKQAEVETVKSARQQHAEMIAQQREQEKAKAYASKLAIQQQREALRKKREAEAEAKREQIRIQFEDKLRKEEQERLRRLQEVERMEQIELELINELQRVQQSQKQAYEELESQLQQSKVNFLTQARALASSNGNLSSRSGSREQLSRSTSLSPKVGDYGSFSPDGSRSARSFK